MTTERKAQDQNRDDGGNTAPGREGREMPEPDRTSGASREMREREGREPGEGGESARPTERPADVGHRREATAEDIARENE